MTRYRRKPTPDVEAMQWTGSNVAEVQEWTGPTNFYELEPDDRGDDPEATASLYVAANSTWLPLVPDEWIIREAKGYYPCKPDEFAERYEPVDAEAAFETLPAAETSACGCDHRGQHWTLHDSDCLVFEAGGTYDDAPAEAGQ